MTKKPVTIDGYYECTDGLFRFYSWNNGQLIEHSEALTLPELRQKQLAEFIENYLGLDRFPSLELVKERGYSVEEIEQAIKKGAIKQRPDGRLQRVDPVSVYLAEIGRRGGSSRSEKKLAASKANIAKSHGRPRKPDSELSPSALSQRRRRARIN